MDFVVRFNYSEDLEKKIDLKAASRQELSEIRDEFYKPKGTDLSDFNPRKVIIRKRTFPNRDTLVKINIIQKPLGYTDTKEEVENLDGYDKWGEFSSFAVEYKISVENKRITVLIETFDFGKFVKIESPSLEKLDSIIQKLDLDKSKIIEKNSAELLAENMNLI